jgi:hypothetical protein
VDTPHPSTCIPAEALARQARLAAVLAAMEEDRENREPASLQSLRRNLQGGAVDAAAIVESLVAENLVEEGAALIRAGRRGADQAWIRDLASLLDPHAARAAARREAAWMLDTRRASVRVGYAKEGAALDFDEGDLHAIFMQAFRLEGLCLALDLGKRPRPMLRLALPLPAGAGGDSEWIEAVFRSEPPDGPDAVMGRLNLRLPDGLRILRWEGHAAYASPLGELARASHWRWVCPGELVVEARRRTSVFLEAKEWIWEKGGKVDGQKQLKPLDLRPLVSELRWEGDILFSTTRSAVSDATNPLKIHAAILGLEPGALWGLVRQSLDLRPDPRLAQAERFEPKLKNMYEDAVLLSGGTNITLVDEDDDEPIRLG